MGNKASLELNLIAGEKSFLPLEGALPGFHLGSPGQKLVSGVLLCTGIRLEGGTGGGGVGGFWEKGNSYRENVRKTVESAESARVQLISLFGNTWKNK